MQWQLLLAFSGVVKAAIDLEPIGEPELVDGAWCYKYLSTYLVPVDAATINSVFPTETAFPSTQRGIFPPSFTNRSTFLSPSTFQAIPEASEILPNPSSEIYLSFSTGGETSAPESSSPFLASTATSTGAPITSSEAVSGQDVILFIAPANNEKRSLGKRASGGFVGDGGTGICTDAAIFSLAGGQLLDSGSPIYYNGELFKEFSGQGVRPEAAITREFSTVAGSLVFALPSGNAGFCQVTDTGQVFITFGSAPPDCINISLRVYGVEECQDGRIIGLDKSSSISIYPTQSTTTELMTSKSTVFEAPDTATRTRSDSSSLEPSSFISFPTESTESMESSSTTRSIGTSTETEHSSSSFSFGFSAPSASTMDLSSSERSSLDSSTAELTSTDPSSTDTSSRALPMDSTPSFLSTSETPFLDSSTTGFTSTELSFTTIPTDSTSLFLSTGTFSSQSTDSPTTMTTESTVSTSAYSKSESATTTTESVVITTEDARSTIESLITTTEDTSSTTESFLTTTEDVSPTTLENSTEEASTTTDAASTATTTNEAPETPTFLVNAGFEDSADDPLPWDLFITASNLQPGVDIKLAVDSDIKHDGSNSGRFDFVRGGLAYVRQPLTSTPEAGVEYTMSAWVRVTNANAGCILFNIQCTYGNRQNAGTSSITNVSQLGGQWVQLSGRCMYTQAHIDVGNLFLNVGIACRPNEQGWVDTVSFS